MINSICKRRRGYRISSLFCCITSNLKVKVGFIYDEKYANEDYLFGNYFLILSYKIKNLLLSFILHLFINKPCKQKIKIYSKLSISLKKLVTFA